jgi:hypothetical protein
MRSLMLTLAVCITGGIAHADILYQFNVNVSSGPLDPFSFSFTAPTFVGDGDTPAFTPFTVTDGTNSWTMTKDEISPVPGGVPGDCFEFGTDGALLETVTCTTGTNAFLLEPTTGVIPTATGTYGLSGGALFAVGGAGGLESSFLTGSLTISSVPEPTTSILLLGGILGAAGWRVRRRLA